MVGPARPAAAAAAGQQGSAVGQTGQQRPQYVWIQTTCATALEAIEKVWPGGSQVTEQQQLNWLAAHILKVNNPFQSTSQRNIIKKPKKGRHYSIPFADACGCWLMPDQPREVHLGSNIPAAQPSQPCSKKPTSTQTLQQSQMKHTRRGGPPTQQRWRSSSAHRQGWCGGLTSTALMCAASPTP